MAPIWRGDDQDNYLHGTWADDTLLGLGGNDMLFGGDGNDLLDGGRGNDMLHGGSGNNIYLFNRGDGQDRIYSEDYAGIGKHNTILFGEGISGNELMARREGEDLVLWLDGSGDQITVTNYFRTESGPLDAARPYAIEELRFADGTVMGQAAILAKIDPVLWLDPQDNIFEGGSADGGAGNDQLTGSWRSDVLLGGEGDDQLSGLEGDDVLIGGAGNDLLAGGEGSNTFEFGQQWGHDTLVLLNEPGGAARANSLIFNAALPGTLRVSSINDGKDLLVAMADGSASVTIQGYFDPERPYLADSVRLHFSDHSVWSAERIRTELDKRPGIEWSGSEIDEAAFGSSGHDKLAGLAGNDQLYGEAGDDLLQGGDGIDDLDGGIGNDTLQGGQGDDFLRGGQGDDTYDGGAGDDYIEIGEGHDVLVFGRESGMDRLLPRHNGSMATVLLEPGITAEDIDLHVDSGRLMTLTIRASSAQLIIPLVIDMPPDAEAVLQMPLTLQFADGTVWDSERVRRELFTGDEGNDAMYGLSTGDWMDGRGGDDYLMGHDGNDTMFGREGRDFLIGDTGNDLLSGGAGIDFLFGGMGNDSLRGGQDKDELNGGSGANNYQFGAGDGNDVLIHAWQSFEQELQTIEFDAGVDPASVTVSYIDDQPRSLKISYGAGDSITILEYSGPGVPGQQLQVRFADGSTWDSAELLRRALLGTDAPDYLHGTESGDIIDGQGSDDVLHGWAGDDRITGGDGNDRLDGGEGDDLLTGGAGNDVLVADGQARDVFLFNQGDGHDFIRYDSQFGGVNDIIRFGEGITRADVRAYDNGDNTVIKYDLNSDIVIENFLRPGEGRTPHIDRFEFADGSSATWRELSNQAPVSGMPLPEVRASEGKALYVELPEGAFIEPDIGDSLSYQLSGWVPDWLRIDAMTGALSGTPGVGDGGEVTLWIVATDSMGLSAETTFHLKIASNQAPVVDQPVPAQRIEEGQVFSYTVPDQVFSDPDGLGGGTLSAGGMPAWMQFDAQTRVLSGTPAYADLGQYNITLTWTDDGGLSVTTPLALTVAAAADLTLGGTAGNDVLVGDSGSDTLTGLGGNDQLDGGHGADRMAGGSGDDSYVVDHAGDLVIENGGEGADQVNASVSFTLGVNVERLALTGSGAINATGNALNNVLLGNAGANVLDGKSGADTLVGGLGNDVYVLDNGSDAVVEYAGGGIDLVSSSVGRTLGAHQEALTLAGTGSISGGGNELNNLVQGNAAANSLSGGAGHDILQGGAGNDILNDSSVTGGVLDGGFGADRLSGGNGADLFIGGAGADTLSTGSGRDIIAFNRGDGQDTVNASAGADNTVSLGDGIVFADLALAKVGADLVLQLGQGEQIAFKSWYAGGASVGTLQVVTEGGADYQAGSASVLHDNKIEQFNFSALVAKFDQARVANPALTNWSVQASLAQCSNGGSDSAAVGGDLAYRYALDDDLSAVGMSAALAIVGSPQFGAAGQALQPGSALTDGSPLLF
jgi:Ca2+-binding RTX toxin-like protein